MPPARAPKPVPRNLVVLLDGTGNELGRNLSNVLKLYRIAEKGDKFDEALLHYEAAAKLKPDNAGVQYACGSALAKLGRKDEARARFEAALKLNPEHERSKKALAELDAPAPAKG